MSYHLVTIFNVPNAAMAHSLEEIATVRFGCQGIEEYALNEPEVDALLGERSYSGGDLPFEVLTEVEDAVMSKDVHLKFYFSEDDLSSAEGFQHLLQQSYLCEVQLQTLEDEDWNAEWKKHYRPIEVTNQLVILPEWEDVVPWSDRLVLRIHPGMGFGTGSHETTFLCLKNFMSCEFSPTSQTFLDYGSGSGILGIAGLLRFNDWKGDFVDIDPEAHRNCRQNLTLNGLSEERTKLLLVTERDELDCDYPLVFANILQNILHQERDYLIEKTAVGGYLILSGLLKAQVAETRELYLASKKVVVANEEFRNDWGCLMLRKLN